MLLEKSSTAFSFSNYCRHVQDLNLHVKTYQRQYINDSLTASTFQIKTLEKYVCDVLITQSCHPSNPWKQRTLANENANRCRRAEGRSGSAVLRKPWDSALPQLLPSSELSLQASACRSLNVTVRGAAHQYKCHCCNQTSPKGRTQDSAWLKVLHN